MKSKLISNSLVLLVLGVIFESVIAVEREWWQKSIFYQIYPRSFQDSDGDGIGDLKGITSRLGYLKETGIGATWLSPIFESPMVDFGYDIANYKAIQPEYGTLQDFDELIARAKELGIKILLDFVPNHTSDKSEWFQKSVQRVEEFSDYYVWHDGATNPKDPTGPKLPPNNWVAEFFPSKFFASLIHIVILGFRFLWFSLDLQRRTRAVLSSSVHKRATRSQFS